MRHVHIHVTGIVQGVGMRPFVYREAMAHGICGWVLNAGDGVHIRRMLWPMRSMLLLPRFLSMRPRRPRRVCPRLWTWQPTVGMPSMKRVFAS